LKGADLGQADLEGAELGFANIEGAELGMANIGNACLCKADLKDARDLTIDQLLETFSLYGVKNLRPELEKKIREDEELKKRLLDPNYEVWGCNDEDKGEWFTNYIKKLKTKQN
jgi:hypothetical protein